MSSSYKKAQIWNLDAYVGVYVRDDNTTSKIVIILDRGRLSLTIWDSGYVTFYIVPWKYVVSRFPENLFGMAYCVPNTVGFGEFDPITWIRFNHTDGRISSFKWDAPDNAYIGFDATFTRSSDPRWSSLAAPKAPLLRLPAEIRQKIYEYSFPYKRVTAVLRKGKVIFKPFGGSQREGESIDGVDSPAITLVCRQLYQETKGAWLPHAAVTMTRGTLSHMMHSQESLCLGRMNQVTLVSGFQRLLAKKDFQLRLHPILDLTQDYTHMSIDIKLDDWVYNLSNPIAFMRTGVIIRQALREYTPCSSKVFQVEIDAWRAGRTVEELNKRKVRIFPGTGHGFPGMQKFKNVASQLLKKKDPVMKDVMIEFGGSLTWFLDEVKQWLENGI